MPEIVLYQVFFDLPFLIFVQDNYIDTSLVEWLEARRNNLPLPYSPYVPRDNEPRTHSIGGLPFYIPNPENIAEPYQLTIKENKSVLIKFLKRVNQTYPNKMAGEVLGDRTGRAAFSSVIVEFAPDLITENDDIIELAIKAINKFIKHYKVIANRFYIRPVTPEVIQTFNLLTLYDDGSQFVTFIGRGSGYMNGIGGAIPTEEDIKLREI
jgi:hypothetical protein